MVQHGHHVKNQSKQQTLSFIVCRRCPGLGLGQVFLDFSISIDEHVGLPLKFLMTKKLKKTTKIFLPTSMILKIIFTNECIYILK